MNILFLSERDPRDTHFGGAQRTNYIWRALQQCGEVYSICFDQQYETEEIAPRIWHGKKLLKVNAWHYFWYRLERKILEPFNVLPLWPMPTKLEKSIDEIFPDIHFDVVVCRYCFDLAEMHLWNFPKVYVDFDDHPLEMYDTLKGRNVHPWLKPLGRWFVKLQMKFIERKITGVWVSNPEQIYMFKSNNSILPLRNIAKDPSPLYQVEGARKPMIISVGAMDYAPNYEGVDSFLYDVWPHVHNAYPDLEYYIIGKGTPESYAARWMTITNVKLLGFVDNLEKMYERCLCSVVSVNVGGGTCIKTLESLAHSRICLSTPFGARGLEDCLLMGDIGLYTFKSAGEFIQIFENNVLNLHRRQINEVHAREYIEQQHSYKAFEDTILKALL